MEQELNALGSNTKYQQYSGKDEKLLERFAAPLKYKPEENDPFTLNDSRLQVSIETDEFTCLCPITGQPDYAAICINYRPDKWCVESKSLKLYLMSFRNEGTFHEQCVTDIGHALVKLLDPVWIEVQGKFVPRGGIQFWPMFTWRR